MVMVITQLAAVAETIKDLFKPTPWHSAHDNEALEAHNGGPCELGILGLACLDERIDELGASVQVSSSISQAQLQLLGKDSTNRRLAGPPMWMAEI